MGRETFFDTYDRYSKIENENFRRKYKPTNWRGQEDYNAVAHALTTAGLVYNHGISVANGLGELRELNSMIFDKENSVNDSLKDNFNNKVGTAIAMYAIDNNLPEEALGALVKDALDRGLLAVSRHKDPRANWYSAIAGRSYEELYDGPSSNVIAGLENTYGVVDLKAGSLSGPGAPAKDLGLTEIETTPEPKPGSFSGEARATTSPFSTPGNTTNEDAAAIFDQEGSGLSPRPKFNRKYQSGYPLSNKPLMPGAKEILPPSFTLKPQVRGIDLAPVSAPRSDNSNKNSLTGRVIPLTGNPFSLSKPNLKLQAEMIERNPVMAKRMILAEKRDPKLFGL